MKVKDIMRKPVAVLPRNAPLSDIMDAFLRHRVDMLPIVDAAQRAAGIISVFDLLDVFFPRYQEFLRDFSALEDKGQLSALFDPAMGGWGVSNEKLILAEDLLRPSGPWIWENESLIRAAAKLKATHQHKMPVVDSDNRLVGILYDYDIVLAFMKSASRERASAEPARRG